MKVFLSILALIATCSGSAFADTFRCKSDDFNPKTYDGQALDITLATDGSVRKVQKVKGSWYCDMKTANINDSDELKLVAHRGNTFVYKIDFGCDESNGRLVIKGKLAKDSEATYSFSDPESGVSKSDLTCQPK